MKRLSENRYVIGIAIISVIIMLGIFFCRFYDTKHLNGKNLNEASWNINEGNYALNIQYLCSEQICLEAYAMSNGQENVIWSTLLEPSDGETIQGKLRFSVPYSVYNKSFRFRTPNVESEQIQIAEFSVSNEDSPVKSYLFLLAFLVCTVAVMLFQSEEKRKTEVMLFLSVTFIMLGGIFVRNIFVLTLFTLLFAFVQFFTWRNNVRYGQNVIMLAVFFLSSITIMMIFSTSSPLYVMNMGTDEHIYYSIAQGMAKGLRLYTDIFDHKGPMFFLLYFLGYLITPGKYYGIYLIESILFTLSMFLVYKTACYYLQKRTAIVVSYAMIPIFLNSNYFIKGGSCEQILSTFLLASLYLTIRILQKQERAHSVELLWNPFVQGIMFSFVFFSKFNVSIAWLIPIGCVILFLISQREYKSLIKYIISFLAGITFICMIVFIMFAVWGNWHDFIDKYFLFNKHYSGITSLTDCMIGIIVKAFNVLTTYKLSSGLIMIGMIGVICSKRIDNLFWRIAFVFSFIVLTGMTYMGVNEYSYYYLLISTFSIFGIIMIMRIVEILLLHKYDCRTRICGICLFFVLCTFYVNNTILESIPLSREPLMQDVLVQEMKRRAEDGDISFFEYDMLENGFVSQAKTAPSVRYFFYPNINDTIYPDVRNEQLEYINNKTTEYIIFERFSEDDYPSHEYLDRNYQFAYMYAGSDQRYWMLYQRVK